MKTIFSALGKASGVAMQAVLVVVSLNSCERDQGPLASVQEKKGARLGAQTNVTQCPPGQHWDFNVNRCVDDGTTGSNDIDPNSINYNTSASSMVTWSQHNDVVVKITPGTKDGAIFHLCELYDNRNPNAPVAVGESIIIKIMHSGSYDNTSYFDMNGKRLGIMTSTTNSGGSSFVGFTPDFSDPNSPQYNADYIGNWGRCVGKTLAYMASGSAIGGLTALGCMAFGPECAATIGLSCGAAATIWNY